MPNTLPTPSVVGEASAIVAGLHFIGWAAKIAPAWTAWIWIVFGGIFIVDWMLGGIADKGICKKCFG